MKVCYHFKCYIIYQQGIMIPEQRKSNPPPGSRLNNKIIQDAYTNAKNNNRTLQALTNIFHAIRLSAQDSQNPGMFATEINKYINTKMLSDPATNAPSKPVFNPAAVYPINKSGALGVLVRQCTISDKGIMQKDGNKPATLKQINNFVSRIQSYQKTQTKEKLEWLKDIKQYPFRIILIDHKNAPKALYCKDRKQAEVVRINYIQKFRYKGNMSKLIKQVKKKFRDQIVQQFTRKLKVYRAEKQKSIKEAKDKMNNANQKLGQKMESQSLSQSPSRPPETSKREDDLLQNLLNKSQISRSNRGYDTNVMKLLIDKQQSRISSKSDADKFMILQELYKKDLFESWRRKAHQIEDNNQIEEEQESIRNVNNNNMKSNSKYINNFSSQKIVPIAPPEKKPLGLTYKSIQFFKEHEIFVKPIVIISLTRNGSVENQTKFNTIIQKKDPHLCYELMPNSGDQTHKLKANPAQYELSIKAIDYLTNSEMCNDKIALKTKVISAHTLMTNNDKSIRLQLLYEDGFQRGYPDLKFEDNPEGSYLQILPISEKVVEEIRSHWEKQVIKRSYYNMSKDIKIIQIFQLYEQPPKSWVLGLNEMDYSIVNILNSASKILNFKLTESILPIIRVLSKLYSQFNQLIEVCLSIMINYMKPYYFISQFNKINRLHSILGLEGQLQLPSKIGFQLELIKRIIKIQCPDVEDKLKRRNIAYAHILYQYIFEIFSNNFSIRILVELWNFLFREPSMLPIYMILISIWLIKFYADKLKKCRRFRQICEILQSHETCSAETIIREVIILRQKYFPNNVNLIDSLRGMFNVKPLEQVVIEFYKRETERLDKRKQNRNAQKKLVLQKLSSEMKIQLPKYPNRSYCLHIYFYKLPSVGGSLYIKANNIEYECLNIPRNRYFIIGEVSTQIGLEFINNKSDEFTCKLQCIQGINKYTVQLRSQKNNQTYKVEYICGLLTEGHIDALKKNRKFQHYIGSFVKQEELFDQFLRPINQCNFLNSFAKRLEKQDLGKKIKVVFSLGSKNFDQIQFYLRWICSSSITLPQKLKLIKQYAAIISQEYFLSECKYLQKIFIGKFLNMIQFHISADQFESFYSDSIQSEFKSPKIIKCRLALPNGTEIKLQETAIAYIATKTYTHLYEDVIINDLLVMIQKQTEQTLSNVSEASLNIIYSSYGQVRSIQVPIVKKKSSKDLIMNDEKFQFENSEANDISTVEPEVLVTEVLPTFSKISTILDFVNNSKSVESLGKNKDNKKVGEQINLLKNCDSKFNKVLQMRYQSHPCLAKFPFLSYYHDLISDSVEPPLPKNLFLNNLQTDIKTICTYHSKLNFFDNKKIQSTLLNKHFGLYGNLRILPPKTDYLYFISVLTEEQTKPNAQLFVNYGYGVFRWEPCIVLGYYLTVKQKQNKLKQQKKTRKQFLVSYKNIERLCRDFQLKIAPVVDKKLQKLDLKTSSIKVGSIRKPGQISASRKQIDSKPNISEGSSRRRFNI